MSALDTDYPIIHGVLHAPCFIFLRWYPFTPDGTFTQGLTGSI